MNHTQNQIKKSSHQKYYEQVVSEMNDKQK